MRKKEYLFHPCPKNGRKKRCSPYTFKFSSKNNNKAEIQQKKAKKPFAPQKTTKSRSSFSRHKTTEHFCVRKTLKVRFRREFSLSLFLFLTTFELSLERELCASLSLEITHHGVVVLLFIPSFSPSRDVFWISPFTAMVFSLFSFQKDRSSSSGRSGFETRFRTLSER